MRKELLIKGSNELRRIFSLDIIYNVLADDLTKHYPKSAGYGNLLSKLDGPNKKYGFWSRQLKRKKKCTTKQKIRAVAGRVS